jgi:hypothetical protein
MWLALCAGVATIGCSARAVAPSDPNETTLAVGARGSAAGVSIELTSIDEDSRCPQDVACVWAGNTKVRVVISVAATDTSLALNTGLPPLTADVAGHRVRIVGVLPARTAGAAIAARDYRVTFRVEPIS